MKPQHTLLFFLLLLFSTQLSAQPNRNQKFAAAVHLGANLAQIDGDYYFGYNKLGLRFGVESLILFRPKSFLTVGLNYTQGGARPTRKERQERNNGTVALRLNSIEVPVMFNYRLGDREATGKKQDYGLFRSITLRAGASFTRLTSFRASSSGAPERNPVRYNFTNVSEEFRNFDLNGIIGITIRTGLKGAIYAEHSKSILGLYQPEGNAQNAVLPLFPYSLTLGYRYVIY